MPQKRYESLIKLPMRNAINLRGEVRTQNKTIGFINVNSTQHLYSTQADYQGVIELHGVGVFFVNLFEYHITIVDKSKLKAEDMSNAKI